MQLEGDTIQSISTYYFETKERDEDKYKSIVRIFAASIYFPVATYTAFSYLALYYTSWIAKYATMYMKGKIKKDNKSSKKAGKSVSHKYASVDETSQKELSFADNSKATPERINNMPDIADNYEKQHRERRVEIFALCIVFILLTFVLIAFHIVASIKFIKYGNEVLYDDNDDYGSMDNPPTPGCTGDNNAMENNDHTYNIGTDDQCLPVVYVTTSFFPTVLLIIILIMTSRSVKLHYNEFKDADETLGICLQRYLGGFLVYLGFYFLPYMLLAFINDPIQTAFIYLIGVSFILCIYLLIYSLCAYVAIFPMIKNFAALCREIRRYKSNIGSFFLHLEVDFQ